MEKTYNITADTRQQGKRYGVRLSLLERNRAILKDYYRMVDKESISKPHACLNLAEKYELSYYRIKEILVKMRG